MVQASRLFVNEHLAAIYCVVSYEGALFCEAVISSPEYVIKFLSALELGVPLDRQSCRFKFGILKLFSFKVFLDPLKW